MYLKTIVFPQFAELYYTFLKNLNRSFYYSQMILLRPTSILNNCTN